MASSINEGWIKGVTKPGDWGPMANYTQRIKCVLCYKVVGYIRNGGLPVGPVLCVKCYEKKQREKIP